MPVYKKQLAGRRVSWYYIFEIPGAKPRRQAKQGGFATKEEAKTAEAARLLFEKDLLLKSATPPPDTLAAVLKKWLADRGPKMSPKTAGRYAELIPYLSPELTQLPITEVTALILHEEWERLLVSGGHFRGSKESRPLSPKTVRNIAGVVSSAFAWATLYGIVKVNPVTNSDRPKGGGQKGLALAPAQTQLMVDATVGQWAAFLEVESGLGARRGEALALRWSDIKDGFATIARSLGQVRTEVFFKATKSGRPREVEVPARTLAVLEEHRKQQEQLRIQFGPTYRVDLDLIFAAPDGEPLRPDSVSSKISLLCRRLRMPKGVSLHTLRHSHGSQLIAAKVPITEVSERLGHSSPNTTLGIYSHAVPGESEAAKKWDEFQTRRKQ